MTNTTRVVLDSWPVLEAVRGSQWVESAMRKLFLEQVPVMSAVNYGEVYSSVLMGRGANEARTTVKRLAERVELDIPDLARTMQAAHLKAHYYISLGDGFAAATALHHDAELWTGDPELVFVGSPWRSRDLRPDPASLREPTKKELMGQVGLRPPSPGRPTDEPRVATNELMDFLGLSEN